MERIRQAKLGPPLPEAEELAAVPDADFGNVLEKRLQFDELVVTVRLVEYLLEALVAEIDVAEEQGRLQEPLTHRHERVLDQADPLGIGAVMRLDAPLGRQHGGCTENAGQGHRRMLAYLAVMGVGGGHGRPAKNPGRRDDRLESGALAVLDRRLLSQHARIFRAGNLALVLLEASRFPRQYSHDRSPSCQRKRARRFLAGPRKPRQFELSQRGATPLVALIVCRQFLAGPCFVSCLLFSGEHHRAPVVMTSPVP